QDGDGAYLTISSTGVVCFFCSRAETGKKLHIVVGRIPVTPSAEAADTSSKVPTAHGGGPCSPGPPAAHGNPSPEEGEPEPEKASTKPDNLTFTSISPDGKQKIRDEIAKD